MPDSYLLIIYRAVRALTSQTGGQEHLENILLLEIRVDMQSCDPGPRGVCFLPLQVLKELSVS